MVENKLTAIEKRADALREALGIVDDDEPEVIIEGLKGSGTREYKFIRELCRTGNIANAVRIAGYPVKSPAQLGYQLLRRSNVNKLYRSCLRLLGKDIEQIIARAQERSVLTHINAMELSENLADARREWLAHPKQNATDTRLWKALRAKQALVKVATKLSLESDQHLAIVIGKFSIQIQHGGEIGFYRAVMGQRALNLDNINELAKAKAEDIKEADSVLVSEKQVSAG